jgi:hypothetical protein
MVSAVVSHLKRSSGVREVQFVVKDTREYAPFQKQMEEVSR